VGQDPWHQQILHTFGVFSAHITDNITIVSAYFPPEKCWGFHPALNPWPHCRAASQLSLASPGDVDGVYPLRWPVLLFPSLAVSGRFPERGVVCHVTLQVLTVGSPLSRGLVVPPCRGGGRKMSSPPNQVHQVFAHRINLRQIL
jgi:hypothetical protein